ncbi:MAG: hypothetical protein OEM47_03990 [Deltaproteobacteria bacterium]|nr:hypothetical protein [Deltaproteobacteria bacterium]
MTGRSALRMVRIATILCLFATLGQADDRPAPTPIFSGDDGSRAWVEVSRSGNRTKAVPVLEISGKTVRKMTAGDDTERGLLTPPAKDGGGAVKMRTDIGDIVERHKSLVIREGPEGVSLGNALDLMGEIQEALNTGRGNQEKREGIFRALMHVPGEKEPVAGSADAAARQVMNLPEDSGLSSGNFCPSLVSR